MVAQGEACGLVKNLALTAHITSNADEQPILRMLLSFGVIDTSLLSAEEVPAPPCTHSLVPLVLPHVTTVHACSSCREQGAASICM